MMKNILFVVMLMFGMVYSQNKYRTDGVSKIIVADVSTANCTTLTGAVRGIYSETGGIVKVRQKTTNKDSQDVVITLPEAVWMPLLNVSIVFMYYTGTTPTTCQTYNSSGSLVNGVKLGW